MVFFFSAKKKLIIRLDSILIYLTLGDLSSTVYFIVFSDTNVYYTYKIDYMNIIA